MFCSLLIHLLTFIIIFFFIFNCIFKYPRWCRSKLCLIGKTAIITGGGKGMGYFLALDYASRGCKVIVTCRSNGDEIKQKLIEETKNPNIIAKYLDLTSFESIRKFAEDINKTEDRLDILVNNAGIGATPNLITKDGLNAIMQTNHLGPFLLTHLLVDLLKKSSPSKIIFVASALSFLNNLTIDNINYIPKVVNFRNMMGIYENSKLCNIISAKIFAKKLKPFNITCNATSPGLVTTDIFYQATSVGTPEYKIKLFYNFFMSIFSKSPEEGNQSVLHATLSKDFIHRTGEFLWDWGWFPAPLKSRNKQFCAKIWELSEKYVKLSNSEKL